MGKRERSELLAWSPQRGWCRELRSGMCALGHCVWKWTHLTGFFKSSQVIRWGVGLVSTGLRQSECITLFLSGQWCEYCGVRYHGNREILGHSEICRHATKGVCSKIKHKHGTQPWTPGAMGPTALPASYGTQSRERRMAEHGLEFCFRKLGLPSSWFPELKFSLIRKRYLCAQSDTC